MIEINNKTFNNYNYKITWGDFLVSSYGTKRTGIAPFITFNIENNIFIGLEFTFSKEMFENTKLNIKTDVNKYISDVTFEDDKGWISLATENYKCNITRIDKNNFNIEFFIDIAEIKININTTIRIL